MPCLPGRWTPGVTVVSGGILSGAISPKPAVKRPMSFLIHRIPGRPFLEIPFRQGRVQSNESFCSGKRRKNSYSFLTIFKKVPSPHPAAQPQSLSVLDRKRFEQRGK